MTTAQSRIEALPLGSKFWHRDAPTRVYEVAGVGVYRQVQPHVAREEPIAGNFSHWRESALATEAGQEISEYSPSMLPMFAKLAEEATRRGYCSEYDSLAQFVGAPTRERIKELTAPAAKKYIVKVPILTHIEIEVEAESEADAFRKSNETVYREAFREQRENAYAADWGIYDNPRKTFSARITAQEVTS